MVIWLANWVFLTKKEKLTWLPLGFLVKKRLPSIEVLVHQEIRIGTLLYLIFLLFNFFRVGPMMLLLKNVFLVHFGVLRVIELFSY